MSYTALFTHMHISHKLFDWLCTKFEVCGIWKLVLVSRPVSTPPFEGLGLISESNAFWLSLVPVSDIADLGFLTKTTANSFVNLMSLIGCKTCFVVCFVVWFYDSSKFGWFNHREFTCKTTYKRKHSAECRFCDCCENIKPLLPPQKLGEHFF